MISNRGKNAVTPRPHFRHEVATESAAAEHWRVQMKLSGGHWTGIHPPTKFTPWWISEPVACPVRPGSIQLCPTKPVNPHTVHTSRLHPVSLTINSNSPPKNTTSKRLWLDYLLSVCLNLLDPVSSQHSISAVPPSTLLLLLLLWPPFDGSLDYATASNKSNTNRKVGWTRILYSI